jgi:transcriptional regulator with XRE-family HTH domain
MERSGRSQPDRSSAAFGQWLAEQLEGRRLSGRRLAHLSGLHPSTISRLLRDQRRPTVATAERLVAALGGGPPYVGPERRSNQVGRVEHALRDDELLTPGDVNRIMRRYRSRRSA